VPLVSLVDLRSGARACAVERAWRESWDLWLGGERRSGHRDLFPWYAPRLKQNIGHNESEKP
jgi:hypothetical protein